MSEPKMNQPESREPRIGSMRSSRTMRALLALCFSFSVACAGQLPEDGQDDSIEGDESAIEQAELDVDDGAYDEQDELEADDSAFEQVDDDAGLGGEWVNVADEASEEREESLDASASRARAPHFWGVGPVRQDAREALLRAQNARFPQFRGQVYYVVHVWLHKAYAYIWDAGGRFLNREGKLPRSYTYYEYDMYEHLEGANRGASRIVVGFRNGVATAAWYTTNHYRSFTKFWQKRQRSCNPEFDKEC